MNGWLTGARNLALAWVSLTLFAGCATQMLAALWRYASNLGEPMAHWFGHPLYAPWSFLSWGLAFLPYRPWIAVLTLVLAGAFVLAALGVFAVASGFAPLALPSLNLRRGFERWDNLRQHGLLAAKGLALGAGRRYPFAKPDIISLSRGTIALLGDPEHTDGALLAAISTWPGALVFVDARGLSAKLARPGVVRFAPGRADSASYNPLLAIRGGVHAWEDTRRLASAFLQTSDQELVEMFALLALGQMLTAPLEERTFAGLRRRLADPRRVLAELGSAWGPDHLADEQPLCEMARVAQTCSADAKISALAAIDDALSLFVDGAVTRATSAHQFRFADLVAGDGPTTLVIAPPPGEAERAAPLIGAMLAQLVAACAPASDMDHLGRRKKRELLIVIEAEACAALNAALGAAQISARPSPSLIPAHASLNGVHTLLQTRSMLEAAGLASDGAAAFDALAAIGPQSEANASALSARGGAIDYWERATQYRKAWKQWLAPQWRQASRPIVTTCDLRAAPANHAYLFVRRLRPIRALALSGRSSVTQFADANALPLIAHDWSAPPIPRRQASPKAPQATSTGAKSMGAEIRKALTRRALSRTSEGKTS